METCEVRGSKFTKAMLGMLYIPFHNVVVTSLVQKGIIDWATQQRDEDGSPRHSFWYVFVLGAVRRALANSRPLTPCGTFYREGK